MVTVEVIITSDGAKQGCALSPILYNILINDLIEYLKEAVEGIEIENTKINTLLFADDVVLIADCTNILRDLLDQSINQSINQSI